MFSLLVCIGFCFACLTCCLLIDVVWVWLVGLRVAGVCFELLTFDLGLLLVDFCVFVIELWVVVLVIGLMLRWLCIYLL